MLVRHHGRQLELLLRSEDDAGSECVVVYWSNSLSCSSGITMWRPPCIAIDRERTTASASVRGTTPWAFTASWNHLTVSASSLSE